MQRFHYATGAAIAMAAAGPLFLIPIAFSVGPMAFLAIPLAIPIGAVIAAIPVIVGGFLMGSLGTQHDATRKPFAWGGAGALLALAIARIFDAIPDPLFTGGFIFTGICCALIVRYGTRWDEDLAE
ncbi:hypothetical protein [Sphingomonas sp.]|uniref:hypothetical protein n=1 Tax=Sphingomonas sp. TaxID=28214 RepID=UPI0031D8D78F